MVKGKAVPIEARLVGDLVHDSEPRHRGAPAAGRPRRAGRGAGAAAGRAATGRGEVVDIVGAPGIGKSRLIEELAERVDARVLWADGDIYARATPYQPMQRLLRRTLALPADVDDDAVAGALVDLVRGTAPDLLPWLPLIAIIAGLDLPTTPEIEPVRPRDPPGAPRDGDQRAARPAADHAGRHRPQRHRSSWTRRPSNWPAGWRSTRASRPWLVIITRRTGHAHRPLRPTAATSSPASNWSRWTADAAPTCWPRPPRRRRCRPTGCASWSSGPGATRCS